MNASNHDFSRPTEVLLDSLEPGRTLAHFRVEALLGRGGMGEVYRATDLKLHRAVALKILPPEAVRDPEARERFLQEARYASILNHPNIVTIYAVDHADGFDFIAMEYVQGETLRARAKRGPFAVPELVTIGVACAEALAAAHALSLIHRDIKPANILVTPGGQPKILDFGLAKRVAETGAVPLDVTAAVDLTSPGLVMGTLGYMSPEQARGASLDGRSDIFSLGCTLYECATGRTPFEGSTTAAVMHATWTQEATPPSRINPALPPEIDAILARCMAKDRDERYGSARELADALSGLREVGEHRTTAIAPPRVALTLGPNNLPAALSTFVGRKRERAEIKRLLGQARLVTLSGPGGSGKTRLAIQVATELLPDLAEGAWLVELAPLHDPGLVPHHVAAALNVRESAGQPLVEALSALIGTRAMLLLLDNCEHLVAACASLATALLRACPNLRILATSQEALGVAGEVAWRIPMLGVPDLASPGSRSSEAVGRYESVRLFVERAGAAQSAFRLTDQNAASIAQICRRVDGIPLAIELAAARVRVLAPDQILARLEDRFKLLTGGSRTSLARQQTLRAAVDWSYDLLAPAEKALLNRLSVFAGGFTLEAVEAVCADEALDVLDLLDLLARLVDRSLVVTEEPAEGQIRYRLLETIRDYGREKLEEAGERAAMRARHAAFFLDLAERAEPELMGKDQAAWLNRLQTEHDNLRHSLSFFIEARDGPSGLRLGGALWRFWWVRGSWAEGRAQLGALLRLESDVADPPERARALYGAAVLARGEGDYAAARPLLEEALRNARTHADRFVVALTLFELGNIANDQEDYATAEPLYEESLAIRRELGDKRGVSAALHNLGVIAAARNDLGGAERLYREALALHRDLGNRVWEAASLNGLGGVAFYQGDFAASGRFHEQALSIQRELGDSRGTAFSLRELGEVATARGDFPASERLLGEALGIYRDLGDRQGIASALEGVAALAAATGQAERALTLVGAAEALREAIQAPISEPDRERMEVHLTNARAALGTAESSAMERGRNLPTDEVLKLAEGDARAGG